MSFEAGKLFWMFLGVMGAGYLIVYLSQETPEDKVQNAFLQTYSQLHKIGQDRCVEAIKEQKGVNPYAPNKSDGDHQTWVSFIWEGAGTIKHAECRYEMGKGVTQLSVEMDEGATPLADPERLKAHGAAGH